MRDAAVRARPNETGGVLLGWYSAGTIHVSKVLEVPDSMSDSRRYRRDSAAAAHRLNAAIADAASNNVGYVGEWHSHTAIAGPSSIDRASINQLAAKSRMPLALVVLATSQNGKVRVYKTATQGTSASIWRRLSDLRTSIKRAQDLRRSTD
jgi:proteasome lid subunit RPN8/RPN11